LKPVERRAFAAGFRQNLFIHETCAQRRGARLAREQPVHVAVTHVEAAKVVAGRAQPVHLFGCGDAPRKQKIETTQRRQKAVQVRPRRKRYFFTSGFHQVHGL
jgi:hypothetical protein